MPQIQTSRDLIVDALKDKAAYKQLLYSQTVDVFLELKTVLKEIYTDIHKEMKSFDDKIEVAYSDRGVFESELKFAADVLIFSMHTNIFNFDDNHFIHKTKYVEEDPNRAYCGMIQVYNFLADSFKYSRYEDSGYLIARIFINSERHFFVEGKRQMGFLYSDFDDAVLNKKSLKAIVESAILYTINFDLLVPPYQAVKEISLGQKLKQEGNFAIKTGKRMGFKFHADSDQITD